jgi:surfeit locus 1 family protein
MEHSMLRFLLTPRWLVGHVLLLATVVACINLGLWQLRRLDERRDHNARIEQSLAVQPTPLDQVVDRAEGDWEALVYRRVVVDGHYRSVDQLLTAPRSRAGRPGQQVLTVLERDGAAPVLIDRGWIPFARDSRRGPGAPDGSVRVEGILRVAEPGDIGTGEQVARIVPAQIAERLAQPLLDVYVQLQHQQPPVRGAAPLPALAPQLTEGNHQSYALQWFSFALIALIGYPALIWLTARQSDGEMSSAGAQRPRNEDFTTTQIR